MKTPFVIYLALCVQCFAAGESIIDLPDDPSKVTIKTASGGNSTESVSDVVSNYPQLKEAIKTQEAAKLEQESEVNAVKRAAALQVQKLDLPKNVLDKHNARIAKFSKVKEDALNSAIKKAIDTVKTFKIDVSMSAEDLEKEMQKVNEARVLASKAKASKDRLVAAGIPISKATQDAVESVVPKAPAPKPTPVPTPDDGL